MSSLTQYLKSFIGSLTSYSMLQTIRKSRWLISFAEQYLPNIVDCASLSHLQEKAPTKVFTKGTHLDHIFGVYVG